MHDYSIDKHPKEKIIFWLAFLAILSTPYIRNLLDFVIQYLGGYDGLVVAMPAIAIFAAIYNLFNAYLWKLSWLRKFLLVPDLNGTWKCKGKTILKNGATSDFEWTGDITIIQSWSKISILFQGKSGSKSISASLYEEKGVGYKLLYQYKNDPKVTETDLHVHTGTAELTFDPSCKEAIGHYYTDHNRNTVGSIHLKKKGK